MNDLVAQLGVLLQRLAALLGNERVRRQRARRQVVDHDRLHTHASARREGLSHQGLAHGVRVRVRGR